MISFLFLVKFFSFSSYSSCTTQVTELIWLQHFQKIHQEPYMVASNNKKCDNFTKIIGTKSPVVEANNTGVKGVREIFVNSMY